MNRIDKYVDLKFTIESLLGTDAWRGLKESDSLATWKRWIKKLFRSIELAIEETVIYVDEEWQWEIKTVLHEGRESLKDAKEIDEIISVVASVFIKLSFWQLGFMPQRGSAGRTTRLSKAEWNLSFERTVVYAQSTSQKNALFVRKLQRSIGVPEALNLEAEYRRAGTNLCLKDWLEERRGPRHN